MILDKCTWQKLIATNTAVMLIIHMANLEYIPFFSDEGVTILFPEHLLPYTTFLEMLYRRRNPSIPVDEPLKTGVCEKDLILTMAICDIGMYPGSHQRDLSPSKFDTFVTLCNYMGIDAEEDSENLYINDFLAFFGREVDDEDSGGELYEGWTNDMIAEQQEEDEADAKWDNASDTE